VGYGIGWSLHYFLIKALESVKLTVSDIQSVKITGAADGIAALESRSIDVFAIWDPFYASAEKTMKIRTIVDAQGFAPNRGFTLATPDFARTHADVVKVILEELQTAGNWANQNQRQASELLSPLLGIDADTLEVTMKRQTLGIVPMNEQVIKEQQEIADVFFQLKLIAKQIQVKEVVASHPQWFPDSLAKT
jgi:sulfonate transport system substrate-binding protein